MAEPTLPSQPDPARLRLMAKVVVALALIGVAISIGDVATRHTRANPFEPGANLGVPPIAESPWHPMRHLDPSKLPWVLDPINDWPADLRQAAEAPCGLAQALQLRYGAWLPKTAREADAPLARCEGLKTEAERRAALAKLGFKAGDPTRDGPVLLQTEDGWVLERVQQGQYELALVRGQGLVLRASQGGTP